MLVIQPFVVKDKSESKPRSLIYEGDNLCKVQFGAYLKKRKKGLNIKFSLILISHNENIQFFDKEGNKTNRIEFERKISANYNEYPVDDVNIHVDGTPTEDSDINIILDAHNIDHTPEMPKWYLKCLKVA